MFFWNIFRLGYEAGHKILSPLPVKVILPIHKQSQQLVLIGVILFALMLVTCIIIHNVTFINIFLAKMTKI